MKALSICIPFYRNPGMLEIQYQTWAGYPKELKKRVEVVLCDDGSPEPAESVPRPEGMPELRIYRMDKDRPWNHHAARNVTAYQAAMPWLLITDMDHVLPADGLEMLFTIRDKNKIYKFLRQDAPHRKPKLQNGHPHPHPNSFAITRDLYIKIGGYDERLSGVYGTDSLFRHCSQKVAGAWVQTEVPLVRYSREVVPDASTYTLDRDAYRNPQKKKNISTALQEGQKPHVLTQEYQRVL